MRLGMNDKVELSRRTTSLWQELFILVQKICCLFSSINDFVFWGVKTDKYQPMNDRVRELNCVSMDLLSKTG